MKDLTNMTLSELKQSRKEVMDMDLIDAVLAVIEKEPDRYYGDQSEIAKQFDCEPFFSISEKFDFLLSREYLLNIIKSKSAQRQIESLYQELQDLRDYEEDPYKYYGVLRENF